MSSKKKVVLVGVGARARLYYETLLSEFADDWELVALCDLNETRMKFANALIKKISATNTLRLYKNRQFAEMLEREKPDTVIITSIDRTHDQYIVQALDSGCRVITEKPLTIDARRCQAIIDTVKRTNGKLRIAFNYRFAPHNTRIKELLMGGAIGKVFSVHFEWLLDTHHGADYFRRWHRDKRNSGGLLVHKASHHFDLVNFWLDTQPEIVFAFGDLMFYGRENAESRGLSKFYSRAYGSSNAEDDKFALHLDKDDDLKAMYLDAEHEDGYFRDQSVFGDGISIEDTMGVLVRYKNGAILTYSLNAYMPWEGFRIAFNGSAGRIEAVIMEDSYNSGKEKALQQGSLKNGRITFYPMFGHPEEVEFSPTTGGHGGGDPLLMADLFGKSKQEKIVRSAFWLDGVMSVLPGIAANVSIRTGQPVKIANLVKL